MGRWSEFVEEWKARKAGRKHVSSDLSTAARDLSGRLGYGTTALWDQVEGGQAAYKESFDRRLPPSLHISERDRIRAGDPIPRQERRVEDFKTPGGGERLTVDDILAAKANDTDAEGGADPANTSDGPTDATGE